MRAHLGRGGACILTTHGSLRPVGFEAQECELLSGRQQGLWEAAPAAGV